MDPVETFGDFVLLLLAQFAGGSGPPENNLVRFGLAAILWALLLVVAWSRQRHQSLPREKLLVWGFGLGLARETFMFVHVSAHIFPPQIQLPPTHLAEPLEHALTMAAVVVVAGAFLRYILNEPLTSRRFLQVGLAATAILLLGSWVWWVQHLEAAADSRFNQTWAGVIFHLATAAFAGAAIVLLARKNRSWLSNVVSLALGFIVIIGILRFINFATDQVHSDVYCRVCNGLHILVIPILGYVYIREQSIEKQMAEQSLAAYRDHLEDLIKERTAALRATNAQLQVEITEREQAQVENARLYQETGRWAEELALLHASSVLLTATLEPAAIYRQVAEQTTKLLGCPAAAVMRWNEDLEYATLVFALGLEDVEPGDLRLSLQECAVLQELMAKQSAVAIGDTTLIHAPCWFERFAIKAVLCIPLLGKDQPFGLLALIDQKEPRNWSHNEVAWAESYANHAALALEKAYFYTQIERVATLEERQRIAAEMHDGLAQTLSYLSLKANYATDLLQSGNIAAVFQQYEDIEQAIDRATQEVRRSIASLRENPPPRESLQDCLVRIVEEVAPGGVPAVAWFDQADSPLFLPPSVLEQVLRVTREALVNAVRHAQASHVAVRLEKQDDMFLVSVEDDGQGFDPTRTLPPGDHFGLSVMRARAARIKGQLTIDSVPGRGSRVVLAWSARSNLAKR